MKYKRILVTSGKGGVGKSTVCANLAEAFARAGYKTLAIDLDLSNRCLDLFFGCAEDVVYDVGDVIEGRVPLSDALLSPSGCERLFLLPGYLCSRHLPPSLKLDKLLRTAEEEQGFDVILIDTSGSADRSASLAASVCEAAFVVAGQTAASIRAAETSGIALREAGLTKLWLIINGFDTDLQRGSPLAGLRRIIDESGIPLLGVVPRREEIVLEQEKGHTVAAAAPRSNTALAFRNIAGRFAGEHIPLFEGFRHVRRRRLIES